jgi:hypothetical protein
MRLFLDSLQEKLIGEFDALAEKQRRIPADEFNDDDKYKLHLNEVPQMRAVSGAAAPFLPKRIRNVTSCPCSQALDGKNKLLNKHKAILVMRLEPVYPAFPMRLSSLVQLL